MSERMTAGGLDMEALRRVAAEKDAEAMIGLYADDAEFVRVDRNNPPSSPMTLRGKKAIAEYYRDVLGREMTHRVETRYSGKSGQRSTGRASTRTGQGSWQPRRRIYETARSSAR